MRAFLGFYEMMSQMMGHGTIYGETPLAPAHQRGSYTALDDTQDEEPDGIPCLSRNQPDDMLHASADPYGEMMKALCRTCGTMTEHQVQDHGRIVCNVCGRVLIDFW
jgi:ribosomal protein S27E